MYVNVSAVSTMDPDITVSQLKLLRCQLQRQCERCCCTQTPQQQYQPQPGWLCGSLVFLFQTWQPAVPRYMVSSTESQHVLQQRATIISMLLASARSLTAQAVSMFAMHATHDSADGQPSASKDHHMCTFFTCDDAATAAAAACCSSPELFM
jgi:hypothetical protein